LESTAQGAQEWHLVDHSTGLGEPERASNGAPNMSPFVSINPATGGIIAEHGGHTDQDVARAVRDSSAAQQQWRQTDMHHRSAALRALGEGLRQRQDVLTELMAVEMGKPLAQGAAEVNKCAWVCDYYAEHAPSFLADETLPSDGTHSYVRHDPLGLILAIMPWNFPLWQVLRFGAPAMMAGNAVLMKHAPNVPGCANAIEDLVNGVGALEGLLTNLRLSIEQTHALIGRPEVAAVTLTGSTRAGASVAETSGSNLKKVVLELGGSDPFIVLQDADLARAARIGTASRLLNSGQSCIAAKRFIVVESVADAFVEHLSRALSEAHVGDPLSPNTQVGPMARSDLRDALHAQVRASVDAGAVAEFGGDIPDGTGWFYPVTLLTNVGPGMPAWDEELFGPVAAVRVVRDTKEAINTANDSEYGLGAAVFTADMALASEMAHRLRAGAVFINGMVKSDPRLPFGGIKRSGYGRELSWHGIREFVNTKTVWVHDPTVTQAP
jgi:succinate-semialdehyde dehydrogenase / glutarate-semialdehyde dehydrogenase